MYWLLGWRKEINQELPPRGKKYNKNSLAILENKELWFGHSKLCFVLIKDAGREIFFSLTSSMSLKFKESSLRIWFGNHQYKDGIFSYELEQNSHESKHSYTMGPGTKPEGLLTLKGLIEKLAGEDKNEVRERRGRCVLQRSKASWE